MTSKELALKDSFGVLSQSREEVASIVQANLGVGGINEWQLDRIKIPTGGNLNWTVESLEGEEQVKELVGIIVAWKDQRTYWKESFAESGGGAEPDCSSPDAVQGYGDPGIQCEVCPNSQWGSGNGGIGQACKLTRSLYFLRQGSMLPDVVVLSPTSIPPVAKYFQRLAAQAVPFYGVITKLGLERAKSKGGGIAYSKVVPTVAEVLSLDEQQTIRAFAESVAPIVTARPPVVSDATEEEEATGVYDPDVATS